MKKILLLIILCFVSLFEANAIEYGRGSFFDVSGSVNANYLWRGERLGGLSFQPEVTWGYTDRYENSVCVGLWGSIGDGVNYVNPWRQFYFAKPFYEMDLYVEYSHDDIITIGVNHMFYFDASPYFYFGNSDASSTQTEAYFELCVSELFPLTIFWSTIVAGWDGGEDYTRNNCYYRPYSTYIELSYPIDFNNSDWCMTPKVGFSPWLGYYSRYEKDFVVNNVELLVERTWEFNTGYVDLHFGVAFNFADMPVFKYNQNFMWNIGCSFGI